MTHILKSLACAAGILLSSCLAAAANPSIVIDADTGQVISAEDATRPWIPASTTKMMTVYLALKAIREGRARLDSPLQVSALAAHQKPVKMYFKPGQIITLDNALKIMLVKSANDLAYVIAEGIGGSVDNFAAMMNAQAARLGMRESHFVNPNGWDAPGHQTSARDLAILARALLRDFPEYGDYFHIGAVALGNRVIKNTNGLIGRYPGAIGMKTGFVCASGFNVVAVAERDGRRLIAVVLGAGSGAERTLKAAQLLDDGFANARGNLGTPDMLPASGYTTPPNMCNELRHRGAPLSDDYESEAALPQQQQKFDQDGSNPAYAMLLPMAAQARSPMTTRGTTGRLALGPRDDFVPIPVYLGPAPGSNAPVLAARSSGPAPVPGAIPANAMALAPFSQGAGGVPLPADQIAPTKHLAARPGPVQEDADDAVGAPLPLGAPPKAAVPAKGKAVAIRTPNAPTTAAVTGGAAKSRAHVKAGKTVATALPKGALDAAAKPAAKAKPKSAGTKPRKAGDQD